MRATATRGGVEDALITFSVVTSRRATSILFDYSKLQWPIGALSVTSPQEELTNPPLGWGGGDKHRQ